MKKSSVIVFACVIALCAAGSWGAGTRSVTVGDNQSYVIEGVNYTVHLGAEDAVVMEKDGRRSVLRVDACIKVHVVESCLNSVSEESASFIETDLKALLEPKHKLATSTIPLLSEVETTITTKKTGELDAEEVFVTLDIPDGIELDGDSGTVTLDIGTIREDKTTTYALHALKNGTFTISGTMSYFDGNSTREVSLDTLTLKVEAPVTYTVVYNNSTGSTPTRFSLEFTKKTSDNYTVDATVVFPPETIIESTSRNVNIADTVATFRRLLNTTKININISYSFLKLPTEQLKIYITVSNSSDDMDFQQNLSFDRIEDTSPALAIGVDPMEENRTGTLKVIITGNRTGNLSIESTLLNKSMLAKNDTYEFPLGPAPKGTYAIRVSFTSINPYGELHTAKGTIGVTVTEKKVVNQTTTAEEETEPAPETNPPAEETVQPENTNIQTLVWIGVGSAVAMLIILLYVVKRFSDPLTKIEHLMEQAELLRLEMQARGKLDLNSKEYKQLEKIERELAYLQKKL